MAGRLPLAINTGDQLAEILDVNTLLFLCTGNYYRSRFAEFYFRHLATERQLDWRADSRGLRLHPENHGPLSHHTVDACQRLGISTEPLRLPLRLQRDDLDRAGLTIAVKETEHRPLLRQSFPDWEDRIEYWEVHDLDFAPPHEALQQLRHHVELLVARLHRETLGELDG